jgi:type I restriction enzyme, S subunit
MPRFQQKNSIFKSPNFIYYGIPRMTGTADQKRIPEDYFSENPFPLPPTTEQKRIVEKFEQLMGLCDELELKLRKAREDSEKLMETVVRGLLERATS